MHLYEDKTIRQRLLKEFLDEMASRRRVKVAQLKSELNMLETDLKLTDVSLTSSSSAVETSSVVPSPTRSVAGNSYLTVTRLKSIYLNVFCILNGSVLFRIRNLFFATKNHPQPKNFLSVVLRL